MDVGGSGWVHRSYDSLDCKGNCFSFLFFAYFCLTRFGQWRLKHATIAVRHLTENHTGDNIAKVLVAILREKSLDETKVVAMTTDRGANMKSGTEKADWPWLPCVCHVLNTIMQTSLKEGNVKVKEAVKAIHDLVSSFLFISFLFSSCVLNSF
jgi:hypothetical protein